MKLLLITIAGVLGATVAPLCAQGTIQFVNNSRLPFTVRLLDGTQRLATSRDELLIGAFYGPAGSLAGSLVLAPGLATIGPVDGVMINAPAVFPLPGTEPAQTVSLQIRAWDAALGPDGWREAGQGCVGRYYGVTKVSQMVLGPTDGPSALIWSRTRPSGFDPLIVYACPEPSVIVHARSAF
jgi:hypothetical protein